MAFTLKDKRSKLWFCLICLLETKSKYRFLIKDIRFFISIYVSLLCLLYIYLLINVWWYMLLISLQFMFTRVIWKWIVLYICMWCFSRIQIHDIISYARDQISIWISSMVLKIILQVDQLNESHSHAFGWSTQTTRNLGTKTVTQNSKWCKSIQQL